MVKLVWGMQPNGPAVGFSKRNPTTAPPQICPGGQKAVTVQGGFGACFCHPGTNLNEHYACRGTSMIGAGKLSRYGILIGGTGAVSRYRLSRSQKTITMQDLYWGQVSVSGFKMLNEFFWPADCQGGRRLEKKKTFVPIFNIRFLLGWRIRHQAKTVTSLLTLPSVLAVGFTLSFQLLFCSRFELNINMLFLLFCFFQIEIEHHLL